MAWYNTNTISARRFNCGHCNSLVASEIGYREDSAGKDRIYICPHCNKPSHFTPGTQIPGVAPGNKVESTPHDVTCLYEEARKSTAVGSYTAAVLTCRKLLMNIAVSQGAQPNLKFIQYVDYLADKGYVPPNGKGWVDHIRNKGNEATHEIALMSSDDATELIAFSEMLLKFIYEFPARVPKKKTAA